MRRTWLGTYLMSVLIVVAVAFTSVAPAQAAEAPSPPPPVPVTAAYTAGVGALAGGGGALLGGAFAVVHCRALGLGDCYLPLLYMPALAGIGTIIGLGVGANHGARRAGREPHGPVRIAVALGFGGMVLFAGGIAVLSAPVALTGATIGFVGAPLAAGLAARRAKPLSLAVTPTIGLGRQRVMLGVRGVF